MPVKPAIIPNLRYDDAKAAIDFLCTAFGFERHAVFADDESGKIVHAQLVHNGNMIMLADAIPSPYADAAGMKTVRELGGNGQSLYLVLDDVDGHCATARAAGAKIIMEPQDQNYGGRGYSALDPQGVAWSFGSYDPWAEA